jgi:4'-phosphopantetheinyl transferase
MVRLFAIKLVDEEEFSIKEKEVKRFAQPATLQKIDSYKSAINRQRKLFGEMLAYKGLQQCFNLKAEDIIFEYGSKGKPALKNGKDKFFNITHSGDWVVCGVSDTEIGVDIELLKKARMNVADRFFTTTEVSKLNSLTDKDQDDYFYLLWTVKESYLKYLGTGLTKPLNSFDVICEDGIISVNESDFSLQLKFSEVEIDDNHKTIVCSGQEVASLDILEL